MDCRSKYQSRNCEQIRNGLAIRSIRLCSGRARRRIGRNNRPKVHSVQCAHSPPRLKSLNKFATSFSPFRSLFLLDFIYRNHLFPPLRFLVRVFQSTYTALDVRRCICRVALHSFFAAVTRTINASFSFHSARYSFLCSIHRPVHSPRMSVPVHERSALPLRISASAFHGVTLTPDTLSLASLSVYLFMFARSQSLWRYFNSLISLSAIFHSMR